LKVDLTMISEPAFLHKRRPGREFYLTRYTANFRSVLFNELKLHSVL
jgi:hypothetical protein